MRGIQKMHHYACMHACMQQVNTIKQASPTAGHKLSPSSQAHTCAIQQSLCQSSECPRCVACYQHAEPNANAFAKLELANRGARAGARGTGGRRSTRLQGRHQRRGHRRLPRQRRVPRGPLRHLGHLRPGLRRCARAHCSDTQVCTSVRMGCHKFLLHTRCKGLMAATQAPLAGMLASPTLCDRMQQAALCIAGVCSTTCTRMLLMQATSSSTGRRRGARARRICRMRYVCTSRRWRSMSRATHSSPGALLLMQLYIAFRGCCGALLASRAFLLCALGAFATLALLFCCAAWALVLPKRAHFACDSQICCACLTPSWSAHLLSGLHAQAALQARRRPQPLPVD